MAWENARRIGIVMTDDLNDAGWTLAGTGASVVLSESNTKAAMTNIANQASSMVHTVSLTAGKWYVPSVHVDTVPAAYGSTVGILWNGTAPSSGAALLLTPNSTEGTRQGWKFQASTTESNTITFGIAAVDANAGTVIMSDFILYEYDEEPTLYDKYYECVAIDSARFPLNFYTKFNAASTESSGAITEITPTDERNLWPGAIVHFMGDSQNAGSQGAVPPGSYTYPEYSEVVRAERAFGTYTCGVINDHIAGDELATVRDNIASYATGSRWPADMVTEMWTQPHVLFLEGGGNDILNNTITTVAEFLTIFDGAVSQARTAGFKYIAFLGVTPADADAGTTAAENTLIEACNDALEFGRNGVPYVDIYAALRGDVNTQALSDTTIGAPDTRTILGANADFIRNPSTDDLHMSDQGAGVVGLILAYIVNVLVSVEQVPALTQTSLTR
jgi:lysophospholipase L1-like esterase